MDATGTQRWNNERGDPAARRRTGVLAQRARQQSRDPVLGGWRDKYDNVIDYDKLLDFYYNQFHDLLHYLDKHHHHGARKHDVIVHEHDGGDHYHETSDHNVKPDYHLGSGDHYGPADHHEHPDR